MKHTAMKLTAAALSAAVLLGIGAHGFSVQADAPEGTEPAAPAVTVSSGTAATAKKDETVYILSGADGSVQKTIVSSWLSNPQKADVLKDVSNLQEIENVKGDEGFTVGKNGSLTWQAEGQDIYYEGTTDQELPVEVRVSYQLDGKPISPEELAGKSGHVVIRFDYLSRQSVKINEDGRQKEVKVPFVMLTGVLLDTEHFSNLHVTNGRFENMGNAFAVLGVALPGAQESLGIDREELEIPEYVEISADAEAFEMGSTMTLAASSVLGNLDAGDFSAESLREQASQLTDGMNQLMDGSNQLYDGLNLLLDQTKILVEGVDKLSAGAISLQSGASQLSSGASQLCGGAAQLSDGLSMLNSKSGDLRNGARQVFNSLLSNANTQLAAAGLEVSALTIENYGTVLNSVIASLDENAVYASALQQVTDAVNARRAEVEAAVTEVVREQVRMQVREQVIPAVREKVEEKVREQEDLLRLTVIRKATGMSVVEYELALKAGLITEEQQAAVEAALESAIAAETEKQMQTQKVQDTIDQITEEKTEEQMQTEKVRGIIAENTELQVQKLISETMASDEVQSKLQAAAEGAKSLIALKSSLDSYNAFYLGILAYTDGVGSATAGAKELISGSKQLSGGMETLASGASELSSGLQTMKGKTPEMLSGITALRDGSRQLKDGLIQLMEEGISKITDFVSGDLEGLTSNLHDMLEAAKAYDSFSGIAPDAEGTVKFVIKTEAIEAD